MEDFCLSIPRSVQGRRACLQKSLAAVPPPPIRAANYNRELLVLLLPPRPPASRLLYCFGSRGEEVLLRPR